MFECARADVLRRRLVIASLIVVGSAGCGARSALTPGGTDSNLGSGGTITGGSGGSITGGSGGSITGGSGGTITGGSGGSITGGSGGSITGGSGGTITGGSGGTAGAGGSGGTAGSAPCERFDSTARDISAGQGPESGHYPSVVIDAANRKLLAVTENGANSSRPSLFRCELDGTACTHTDISAGQAQLSGTAPSALIDARNAKLLVVTENNANSQRASLFRCELDGTACTHTDISAGQGADTGYSPSAVIDELNLKLLVVTLNTVNSYRPSLFRCELDGTACTHTDISAGQDNSGWYPSTVIDATNRKLLVVTVDAGNQRKPSLFRCNLDGTACTHSDISVGQGYGSGWYPSAVIDAANGKLLAVTENGANSFKPWLFRCNLDGTACTSSDISVGQGMNSGLFPSAVVDAKNGKLLVATYNDANSGKPSLFRCELDGTGCTHTDISAGQAAQSGLVPSAVLDAAGGKLLVVTEDYANSNKPELFSVCIN